MSMRYWWLSSCMEDSSVHACDVTETPDSSNNTVIYGHAHSKRFNCGLADDTYCLERSTLAMSNSEVLYAGKCCTRVLSAWHVHVVERQLFRRPPAFSAQPTQPLHVFWRGGLSQVFWQCCQFPDTFCICKPFFIARTTLTLVEGTVTKRTNT